MSSATSTEGVRQQGVKRRETPHDRNYGEASASGRLQPWHFFVVCAMLAATVAVTATRDNTPGNLLMLSVAIVAAGFVGLCFQRMVWPLVSPETEEATAPLGVRARVTLEREKALVLRSIKELEFDRAMGKVADPDFNDMVARLRGRAIGLLRQLDERRPGYRELIEREVHLRLAAGGKVRPKSEPATSGSTSCPQCQTSNDADARFCKSCGTRL